MKVLYDHQAFRLGKFAGIPRYFTDLISHLQAIDNFTPILPNMWSYNQGYRTLHHCKENSTWVIRDKVVDTSLKIFHQNPSRLIDGAEIKTRILLKKQDFDIFHPTWLESYFIKDLGRKPCVLTIHDFTPEKYPESTPKAELLINRTQKIVKFATRFIAISEYTKHDLMSIYDIDNDLIDVVYHGSPFEDYQIPKRTEYNLEGIPFVLYVGGRTPYKNFNMLVHALAPLLQEKRCTLLCVGGGAFQPGELELFSSLGVGKYISQENASDLRLISLYQKAALFVYPSLNEGFGLPVLEAMSSGCPVVCSNVSSLPEVGGDAAKYFDPLNVVSIREAVVSLLDTPSIGLRLINQGYNQVKKFSWKKCSRETMDVYNRVL